MKEEIHELKGRAEELNQKATQRPRHKLYEQAAQRTQRTEYGVPMGA